jgi:lipopolysaccharide/colanic/teichoic acid biosynthesis glycosyltransferase
MLKRLVDIVCSVLGLVVLGPLMLAIALEIRRESPGPALFRHRRAGRGGRPFTMLKFRTMRADADPYGASPHSGDDPRLTPLGRRLREASLDELPQLLNVLSGQMSLVGPRPLYERQARHWTPRQRRRLDVRPGLTGYAQAYGRAELPIEDKIELDLYYVEHQSLLLDLRIGLKTVVDLAGGRGAVYEQRYSRQQERETDAA